MLYATTRDKNDVFTAYKAIHTDRAPSGGLYVPFQLPKWERTEVKELADMSFCQIVARVLNDFFSCRLTAWDLEFVIGRNPVVMTLVNHRVEVCELWHNPKWDFDHIVQTLSQRIRKEDETQPACEWVRIAVSIGVVFGLYGQYLRQDIANLEAPVDVAVDTGDFSMPMAAWYARQMGLPIGNIICGCNANGAVWELLHRGQMNTDHTAVQTLTPQADIALPDCLERLIRGTLGVEEVSRLLEKKATGAIYAPMPEDLEKLRSGMFAAVISDSRIRSLLLSVYRTSQYIFGPYGILAYGSLMDYRAKTGESRTALLLSRRSPICDGVMVAQCLDLSLPELHQKLNLG